MRSCATECGEGAEVCQGGTFAGCSAPTPGPEGCPAPRTPFVQRFDFSTSEVAEDIAADSEGLIVAGRTSLPDASQETWLVKVDHAGSPLWQVTSESPDWDQLSALVLRGGEVLAFGQTNRREGDIHDGLMQIHDASDGSLRGASALELPGGNAFTGAVSTDEGVFLSGRLTIEDTAAWVVALDDDLEVAWQIALDGPGRDRAHGLSARPGGGIVVVGYTEGEATGLDALITAIDAQGQVLWAKVWGGSDLEQAWGAAAFGDQIIIAGHTRSFGQGGHDAFVLAISPEGELLWQVILGTEGDDTLSAVDADSQGVYLGGRSDRGDVEDAWLFRLDHRGRLQWETRLTTEGFLVINALRALEGGAIAWTGFISSGESDWLVAQTPADGLMEGCAPLVTGPHAQVAEGQGSTLGDARLDVLRIQGGWTALNLSGSSTSLGASSLCLP